MSFQVEYQPRRSTAGVGSRSTFFRTTTAPLEELAQRAHDEADRAGHPLWSYLATQKLSLSGSVEAKTTDVGILRNPVVSAGFRL